MAVKADTTVKWFTSDNPNSPTLNGTAGSLVALLDACLVDGYDPRAPDSVTVSGEVCTCTFGGGNPFEQYTVVAITGASIATLNAEWRVATSSATAITFVCPDVPDGVISGTISIKRAPAGWVKVFSDTGKSAYQSASFSSTQLYLRVDDTSTTAAKIRGYEHMTSIDDGSGLFPTLAQRADAGYWWQKSSTASARQWAVIADDSMLYYCPVSNNNQFFDGQHTPFRFGDLRSRVTGDAYHCLISGVASAGVNPGMEGSTTAIRSTADSTSGKYVARPAAQTGTAQDVSYSCAVNIVGEYGASPDGELLLCPMALGSRGVLPGMYVAADRIAGLPFREVVGVSGVPFLRLRAGWNSFDLDRHIAFDITRPWR